MNTFLKVYRSQYILDKNKNDINLSNIHDDM